MGWRDVLAESQYDWDMGIVGGEQPTWAQYHERDPENAALYETCGAGHAKALLSMPPADRIAMARELLEGTDTVWQWAGVLEEAQQYVRDKPQWGRWLDGTPLSNDVAVWMTDFALILLKRAALKEPTP